MNKRVPSTEFIDDPWFSDLSPRSPPNPHPKLHRVSTKPCVPDISILADENDMSKYNHHHSCRKCSNFTHKLHQRPQHHTEIEDDQLPLILQRVEKILEQSSTHNPHGNIENSFSSIEVARSFSDYDESTYEETTYDNSSNHATFASLPNPENILHHKMTTEIGEQLSDDDESLIFDEIKISTNCNQAVTPPCTIHVDLPEYPYSLISSNLTSQFPIKNNVKTESHPDEITNKNDETFYKRLIESVDAVLSPCEHKESSVVPIEQVSTVSESIIIPRMQYESLHHKNDLSFQINQLRTKYINGHKMYNLQKSFLPAFRVSDGPLHKYDSEEIFSFATKQYIKKHNLFPSKTQHKVSPDKFSTKNDTKDDYLSFAAREYMERHGLAKQKSTQRSRGNNFHSPHDIHENENEESLIFLNIGKLKQQPKLI